MSMAAASRVGYYDVIAPALSTSLSCCPKSIYEKRMVS